MTRGLKMMSDNSKNDLVLEVLLEVRAEVAPELDEKLLRHCFEIQRRHQFSQDPEQPSTAMERLIDQIVDNLPSEQEK